MSQAKEATFLAAYDAAVARGDILADGAQRKAAEAFEQLYQQLTQPRSPQKRRWLKLKTAAASPAGLYVWGEVGRGKSMLMDLFVETFQKPDAIHPSATQGKPSPFLGRGLGEGLVKRTPSLEQVSNDPHPTFPLRRGKASAGSPVGGHIHKNVQVHRIHFHAFMRDVHKRLFAYRQQAGCEVMGQVMDEIAGEATLLCLDELQVTDVTDAMILARLFAGLMDRGVTVVFTSNRPPQELYQGGLQREQFLKFVDLLKARMPIVKIDSPEDYRLAKLKAMKRTYVYPRDTAADDFLLESWNTLTHGLANEPLKIEVDGRILRVDKHTHGVAWLTFAELCMRPLGAGDYLELCSYCHTILLQGIPRLTREERNEAKRFVTLIDTLYDHRIKLIATAETAPDGIYEAGDGTFEFARTVSRLIEMQSESYLAAGKV